MLVQSLVSFSGFAAGSATALCHGSLPGPSHSHLTSIALSVFHRTDPFWRREAHRTMVEAELAVEKHVHYIVSIEKKKDSFESLVMEHLRLNGAYWGLTTLDLLHKLDAVDANEVVQWIMTCYHQDSGGFGGNVGHDPHVLYTLSAVQILCLFDRLNDLDVDKVADCILELHAGVMDLQILGYQRPNNLGGHLKIGSLVYLLFLITKVLLLIKLKDWMLPHWSALDALLPHGLELDWIEERLMRNVM